ncbi:MAG: carboxymuconolactone decarboxylase family protein [Caulobacterales bacterium]|nr:carboxymuconolactone decarboxylase family protein [Caulobacterales bacterium]
MTRISKVPVAEWDPELRALVAADEATSVEQGMYRVLAHKPAFAKAVAAFGAGVFGDRTLSRRLVELVRLRIAFHNQCRSCMALRYRSAVDDGLTEGAVCSLEKPQEAADLSDAEKAALRYADLSANDHFSIDEAAFDGLRVHFTEAEIVELGVFIAFFIGFGRLSAAWSMTEDLPEGYQAPADQVVAPWAQESLLVRG